MIEANCSPSKSSGSYAYSGHGFLMCAKSVSTVLGLGYPVYNAVTTPNSSKIDGFRRAVAVTERRADPANPYLRDLAIRSCGIALHHFSSDLLPFGRAEAVTPGQAGVDRRLKKTTP